MVPILKTLDLTVTSGASLRVLSLVTVRIVKKIDGFAVSLEMCSVAEVATE